MSWRDYEFSHVNDDIDDDDDFDTAGPREDFEFDVSSDIEADKICDVIKSVVSRHDLSRLIALYLRPSQRNDFVDVFFVSRNDIPFHMPPIICTLEELLEQVVPVPVEEMWLLDEFTEKFDSVYQSVRDEVSQTKEDALASLYKGTCGFNVSTFHSAIDAAILQKIVDEGDQALPQTPVYHRESQ